VHFSTTSKETFSDKVKRLLRNEVRQLMEQEATGEWPYGGLGRSRPSFCYPLPST